MGTQDKRWQEGSLPATASAQRSEAGPKAQVVEIPCRILSYEMKQTLMALCRFAAPHEICGVINTQGHVLPQPNTAPDTRQGFDMEVLVDPAEVLAVYHSHPNGRTDLSDSDVEGLLNLYQHALTCRYLIVTPTDVTEYGIL